MLITIDTDAVRKNYPNPSQDQNYPTAIDHNLAYMVAAEMKVTFGKGTGDADIPALGDHTVRVFATSGSNNFEDAVLLYRLPRFQGDQVLNNFEHKYVREWTVAPHSEHSVVPAKILEEDFWFYQADVSDIVSGGYLVQFALYVRDNDGKPLLFGFFAWDLTITVAEQTAQGWVRLLLR